MSACLHRWKYPTATSIILTDSASLVKWGIRSATTLNVCSQLIKSVSPTICSTNVSNAKTNSSRSKTVPALIPSASTVQQEHAKNAKQAIASSQAAVYALSTTLTALTPAQMAKSATNAFQVSSSTQIDLAPNYLPTVRQQTWSN